MAAQRLCALEPCAIVASARQARATLTGALVNAGADREIIETLTDEQFAAGNGQTFCIVSGAHTAIGNTLRMSNHLVFHAFTIKRMAFINCGNRDCGKLFDAPVGVFYHTPECREVEHRYLRHQPQPARPRVVAPYRGPNPYVAQMRDQPRKPATRRSLVDAWAELAERDADLRPKPDFQKQLEVRAAVERFIEQCEGK